MSGEIRCPKCEWPLLQIRVHYQGCVSELDEQGMPFGGACNANDAGEAFVEHLDCRCLRCEADFTRPCADAAPFQVQGRESGYYWIRLNDVEDKTWEVGYWDGRVWARCADADPVDEREIQSVGPMIPGYTGG